MVEAAHGRMAQHSPQGLANLNLGLVTLQLHRYTEVKQFMLAAANRATGDLQTKAKDYPDQSLSNLCTAFSYLEGADARKVVESFMMQAAWQAYDRAMKWQDLAEIMNSFSRFFYHVQKPGAPTSLSLFSESLARLAAQTLPQKVGKQALINIGLAVVRMQVSPELVRPLADSIGKLYNVDGSRWNSIDCRQWAEIESYCGYSVGNGIKACYHPGSGSNDW
eukprot:TRINITY_DN23910_c0_g2_i3.p2 TRINITY_DN23910_c0_g2~~TRINITY_DN23910_c0_g2_i3.p2  ORF type:complete len:221 (-),score=54.09 TRINITY_DN23910_c0_g2_i3:231-893(-)